MSINDEFMDEYGYDGEADGLDEDEMDEMLWEESKKQNINHNYNNNKKTKNSNQTKRKSKSRVEVSNEQSSNQTSGCYVATAVYGSYDCPEVWTLRRYRDNQLAKTWYGRVFIHTYYAISPTLVKWFGNTQWFKNLWKPKLDKIVNKLQNEGVENTPYQDRKP